MKTDINIEIEEVTMLRRFFRLLWPSRLKLTQEEIRYLKAFVAQRQQGRIIDNESKLLDESV